MAEGILVLDFGGQYAHLIGRRVRELGVYAEVVPYHRWHEAINPDVKGVILSGGPRSVYEDQAPKVPTELFQMGKPILGICYGAQLMAEALGGRVEKGSAGEYGQAELLVKQPYPLFAGTPSRQRVWMSHGDLVVAAPPGFERAGSTQNCPWAAFQKPPYLFAVQFHPEVVHSEYGKQIFANFVLSICKANKNWTAEDYGPRLIAQIQEQVGSGRVLGALSGGVDSAVAAALTLRAVGSRLTCIYVDTGLQRLDDLSHVEQLAEQLGLDLRIVQAQDRFLSALSGIVDPEQKRKIIGATFIETFEQAAGSLGAFDYFLQGTLYPDVVESGGGLTAIIKSHHNVGGLPEKMGWRLLEPLRWFYKDEVREFGSWLGIDREFLMRHPFPGPGLAVRIIGPVTEEALSIERRAHALLDQILMEEGVYYDVWQAFPVFTGIKSVAVKGDARHYGWVLAVRIVQSQDAMTADWYRASPELLERIASALTAQIPEISRVVYDITTKPPATIEWE
ncbi:glutamine-hydrolyzing GMP synthase [Coprothermobacteraceae bacterium]|nr:glutamine-hydrolyzing GMP synthase [Coprothermobacteraceae bacterium]